MKATPFTVCQDFKGIPISFRNDGWVNATQMAKAFGTKPDNYLRTDSAQRYIAALARHLTTGKSGSFNCGKIPQLTGSDCFSEMRNSPALEVVQGNFVAGRTQGTWMHHLLALDFARWLSPEFSIWCNEIVFEILAGRTVTPDSARQLWHRHTPLELLGWFQGMIADAKFGALSVKEIRGSAGELREALLKAGRECPPPSWLGRWLGDLAHTHGEQIAVQHRTSRRRTWIVRALPKHSPTG